VAASTGGWADFAVAGAAADLLQSSVEATAAPGGAQQLVDVDLPAFRQIVPLDDIGRLLFERARDAKERIARLHAIEPGPGRRHGGRRRCEWRRGRRRRRRAGGGLTRHGRITARRPLDDRRRHERRRTPREPRPANDGPRRQPEKS
jgi:hypothetical protein